MLGAFPEAVCMCWLIPEAGTAAAQKFAAGPGEREPQGTGPVSLVLNAHVHSGPTNHLDIIQPCCLFPAAKM